VRAATLSIHGVASIRVSDTRELRSADGQFLAFVRDVIIKTEDGSDLTVTAFADEGKRDNLLLASVVPAPKPASAAVGAIP
jgi:hypothetical protein